MPVTRSDEGGDGGVLMVSGVSINLLLLLVVVDWEEGVKLGGGRLGLKSSSGSTPLPSPVGRLLPRSTKYFSPSGHLKLTSESEELKIDTLSKSLRSGLELDLEDGPELVHDELDLETGLDDPADDPSLLPPNRLKSPMLANALANSPLETWRG